MFGELGVRGDRLARGCPGRLDDLPVLGDGQEAQVRASPVEAKASSRLSARLPFSADVTAKHTPGAVPRPILPRS